MSNSLQPPGLQHAQASLSFTISWSLLKLLSIESVMPSNRLILLFPSPPQQSLNYINYYFSFSLSRLTRCFALGWRLAGGQRKLVRQRPSSPTFPSLIVSDSSSQAESLPRGRSLRGKHGSWEPPPGGASTQLFCDPFLAQSLGQV